MRDLLLVVALMALGVGGWLTLQGQYIPAKPVALAREFIEAISDRNLAKAFGMTSKAALTGTTEAEFQALVERQILGRLGSDSVSSIKYLGVTPFQSWGNRIRRRFLGREVDQRQCNVDHFLTLGGGRNASLPFEVRLTRNSSDTWEVTYFQSHAM